MATIDLLHVFDNMIFPQIEYNKLKYLSIYYSCHCQIFAYIIMNMTKKLLKVDEEHVINQSFTSGDNLYKIMGPYLLPDTLIIFGFEIYNFSIADFSEEIRKKYELQSIFVPLLSFHTFNILIGKDRIYICQSWFNVMKYTKIYDMTMAEFKIWLDNLNLCFTNFINKKNINSSFESLLSLFKYDGHIIHPDIVDKYFSPNDDIQINVKIETCRFRTH
jgi:hypothetical protein